FLFGQSSFIAYGFEPNRYRTLIVGDAFAFINIDEFDASEQLETLRLNRLPNLGKTYAAFCQKRNVAYHRRINRQRAIQSVRLFFGKKRLQIDFGDKNGLAEFISRRDFVRNASDYPDCFSV